MTVEATLNFDQVWERRARVEDVDAERGIIEVRIVPYEVEADLGDGLTEVFSRGAFSASVRNPSRCKISDQQHGRSVVIGNAIELRDKDDCLEGTLRIADTVAGRDVLTLLRPGPNGSPPVLDEMSVEFRPMKRHARWEKRATDILLRHDKATLIGCSPVSMGAYGREARVLSVRAAEAVQAREREIAYLESLKAGPVRA